MKTQQVRLPFYARLPVLAMGSQRKNTVCFARGDCALISPVHQDLSCADDFSNFEKTVGYFFARHPVLVAHDLHPEYTSTKYAISLPPRYSPVAVQHHHAHIAACMVENGLKNQKVIGVAFDGTGWGSDATLWGGEFLVCNYARSVRVAHLRAVPLLGHESALRQPWKLAGLWLYLAYGDAFLNLGIEFTKKIQRGKWLVLKQMYLSSPDIVLTSSMGRLFDVLASIVSGRQAASREAELAVALEKMARRNPQKADAYPFTLRDTPHGLVIDPLPLCRGVTADVKAGIAAQHIAWRIHFSVARMIRTTCRAVRARHGLKRVVLAGGVFQNRLLLALTLPLLEADGFSVFTHRELSCNDSSLSLGQAAIASYRGQGQQKATKGG
ncbi:MAG TPA: hypothetical protein VMD52_04670 [Patescibacteria group bacterium]|nr:hypothetical protein [Patescibacteria group bacterium]